MANNFSKFKNNDERFAHLKEARDKKWAEILNSEKWVDFILNENFDRRFYGIYLIETYHYVKENPRHQAIIALRDTKAHINYLKFCYEHAEEETGHEMMAFHDLKSLALSLEEIDIKTPLSSTELLIAYLYRISQHGNPLRRLGYSFWAEDSYQYIQNLLKSISDKLNLRKENMTFLVSHSTIDEKHSKEIEEMIIRFCESPDDFEAILEIMNVTLTLQSNMLNEVVSEYVKLRENQPSKYDFLNKLV
jgi:pyrroloquinoline quinone (PQQ) biosynthesis protein C